MRWIIRLLGVVVTLAVLGLVALLLVPAERIARLAAEQLGQSLGREVTISGTVQPSFWPHLAVRAEEVGVANPDWVDDGPMLRATALSVRLPWAAILDGAPQIDEITLIGPQITLVRAADGRASWEIAGNAAPAASTQSTAPAITIEMAEITDGTLRYIDAAAGQRVELTGIDARLALPRDGALRLAGRATAQGVPISFSLDLAALADLMAGRLSDAALGLDWAGGTARFDGAVGLTPVLDGTLSLDVTDLAPVAGLTGIAMPDLPQGLGAGRVALSGQVALSDTGSAHLRAGRLQLDDTALALALDLTQGAERPLIRGTISADTLALPGADASPSGNTGWSSAPIDVSGLFATDAEIALRLGALGLGDIALGPVDLTAALTRGRLVFDIARLAAYGGAVSGQFVVNGRGGLSVGGDLRATEMQLLPLLRDVAAFERLEGTGNGRLSFLGVGNDMASIMAGLSGEGDVRLGAGVVRGIDLATMIRNRDPGAQGAGARTVYDSLSAGFIIADGVLANDDLALAAGWGSAAGAGRVDLGAQSLDYRLIPAI
ncbi:AsmA family protein, partial [Roseicyclus sp.]|uniref:AsmA family protein n=1 Tax=Roseicyclus sp. TaxID=1914329 RepID=UPI003F6AC68E